MRAGSENSDHIFSENSDHLPVGSPGQLVGDPLPSEGKDDRRAQTPRDSGPASRGHTLEDVATLSGVSIGSVRRVIAEPAVERVADAESERERRRVGRPAKAEGFRDVLRTALAEGRDPAVGGVAASGTAGQ